MRYIKLFEAFDRWSRDQKVELQDYCETNLAYLIDDGFTIRVGQNISAHLIDNSGSQLKFNTNPSHHNIFIQVKKTENAEDFFWSDVKDHIIPFTMRLNKRYDIEKIMFFGEGFVCVKDNFEQELDEQPISKVSYIDIVLSDEKRQINESSLSPKEELKDFCDTHLAYLTDEGFYIEYEQIYGGHCTELTIKHYKREKNKYSYDFSWDEIKNRFIPFLYMLSKQYKLFDFCFEEEACKKGQVVLFKHLNNLIVKDYYSYEDIMSDDINANYLFTINLKIGEKINL